MTAACGDVLPLPLFDVRRCPTQGLSRGTVQSMRRNEGIFNRARDVCATLNELYDSHGLRDVGAPASEAQNSALRGIVEAVKLFKPPSRLSSPEEAASELLRTSVGYGAEEPTTVESFCAEKLSLPQGQSRPVPLCEVLSSKDNILLDNSKK